MKESIKHPMKVNHVQWGDAKLFGDDSDVRRRMRGSDIDRRFAEVWNTKIGPATEKADQIDLNMARSLVDKVNKKYVEEGYEYRQFTCQEIPFVARIDKHGICDQLWDPGKHRDPLRLCMYFESLEDKGKFETVARRKQLKPRDLALQICMKFAEDHLR